MMHCRNKSVDNSVGKVTRRSAVVRRNADFTHVKSALCFYINHLNNSSGEYLK